MRFCQPRIVIELLETIGPRFHGTTASKALSGSEGTKLINLKNISTLQTPAQFGLAEVPKKPAVAFHRNLIFEDLQRLP